MKATESTVKAPENAHAAIEKPWRRNDTINAPWKHMEAPWASVNAHCSIMEAPCWTSMKFYGKHLWGP